MVSNEIMSRAVPAATKKTLTMPSHDGLASNVSAIHALAQRMDALQAQIFRRPTPQIPNTEGHSATAIQQHTECNDLPSVLLDQFFCHWG